MTPEEHFARLRDTSNWTVTAPAAPRPVRRFLVIAAPIAIAAVLVVAFVVGASTLRGMRPIPPASPSPTPSALPTAQFWTTPPQRLFNGECSQVFSDTELSGLLGYAVALGDSTWAVDARPRTSVVAHNGGLSCFWKTVDATHPGLTVSIVPAALVPSTTDMNSCSLPADSLCNITIIDSGIVLAGHFGVGNGRALSNPDATLSALRTAFADKVAALHRIPAIYSPNDGDWTARTDCFALAGHIGFGSGFSGAPLLPGSLAPDEYSGDAVPFAGSSVCQFDSSSGGDLAVEILSGGAWLDPLVEAAYANPLDVPGSDSAYTVIRGKGDTAQRILYAFAGTNLVALTTPATGDLTEDDLIAYARNEISGLNSDNSIASTAPPATPDPTGDPTGASASDLPPLSDLVLSSEGLGPLRIGRPVPTDSPLVTWSDDICGGAVTPGQPGWITQYPDSPFTVFPTASRKDSVYLIAIGDPAIRTQHGLHIGSAVADVESLGGKKEVDYDGADGQWVIHGTAGELVFTVYGGTVNYIYVQQEGTPPMGATGLCS